MFKPALLNCTAGFLFLIGQTPMPKAAPKPCRKPACSVLVSDGSGFCAAHQADRHNGKFGDKYRGSRQSRGYDSEWDATRKRILNRDKGLCQPHLKQNKYRPAREVDHIVPKAEGGTDDDDNLQAICTDCHKAKTAEEALRARRGRGFKSLQITRPGPDA